MKAAFENWHSSEDTVLNRWKDSLLRACHDKERWGASGRETEGGGRGHIRISGGGTVEWLSQRCTVILNYDLGPCSKNSPHLHSCQQTLVHPPTPQQKVWKREDHQTERSQHTELQTLFRQVMWESFWISGMEGSSWTRNAWGFSTAILNSTVHPHREAD